MQRIKHPDCFTALAMTDTPEIAMTDTRVMKKRQVELKIDVVFFVNI
jgi:hypothetical protein